MQVYTKFLNKEYVRGKRVIKNLTMKLERGLIVLLGPEGSGKSTLMKMMATLEKPTNGTINYGQLKVGQDDKAIRKVVGYLPQGYRIYQETTPRAQLRWICLKNGIPKDVVDLSRWAGKVLGRVGLLKQADFRVHGLSFGQHRRLGLASALVNSPNVLLLDAPYAGLDEAERANMRTLLDQLGKDLIVITTSSDATDPIEDNDELIVLQNGQMRFRGSSNQLITQVQAARDKLQITPTIVEAYEWLLNSRSYNHPA